MATLARALRADVIRRQFGAGPARPLVELAVGTADTRRQDWFAEVSQRVVVRLRHQCGDATGSTAALLRGCGGVDLSWVEACNRAYWAAVLAEMARTAGRPDEAAHWVEEADRHARRTPLRGQSAYAALARARQVLNEEPESAAVLAATAIEAFAGLGWLFDEAAARLVRAHALGARRQWRPAESELAEVRRLAVCSGSRSLHQAVMCEQRRIGSNAGRVAGAEAPPRRSLDLTRRQWDVVRLVIEGVSNAEIADRLYVTVKTVEAHLTRIFRSVGVSSRVGLVAALAGHIDDLPPVSQHTWF
jgi:DNA-binding CsgD family transcriptional regulator